ncbi:hypothetical protein ACE6H2_018402 [Prunus campanulata]
MGCIYIYVEMTEFLNYKSSFQRFTRRSASAECAVGVSVIHCFARHNGYHDTKLMCFSFFGEKLWG